MSLLTRFVQCYLLSAIRIKHSTSVQPIKLVHSLAFWAWLSRFPKKAFNRPFLLNLKCGKEKSQCRKVFPARVHPFSGSRCFCGNFWMRLAREGQPNSEIFTKTPRFRKGVNKGREWFSARGICFSTVKLSRSCLFLSRGYFLHKTN